MLPQNKQGVPNKSSNKQITNTVWKFNVTRKPTTTPLFGSPTSDDTYLPDLVALSPQNEDNALNTRKVVMPDSDVMRSTCPTIRLMSPPAIICTQSLPRSSHFDPVVSPSSLNDLQSTLEFSHEPLLGSEASELVPNEVTLQTLDSTVPDRIDCEVPTPDKIESFRQSSPKEFSTPKQCTTQPNEPDNRKVVTSNAKIDSETRPCVVNNKLCMAPNTPIHVSLNENSQTFSSP